MWFGYWTVLSRLGKKAAPGALTIAFERLFAQFPSGDAHLFVEESHEEFPRQVIDSHADRYYR